ncbi:tyrosine-type recombinase/integrase [Micromonospora fluostatini]
MQRAPFYGEPDAAEELAGRAKKLVEAHRGRITRDEVMREILAVEDPAHEGVPLLRDWVETWLKARTPADPENLDENDIQPSTLDWYRTVLTSWVVPYLGHKRLTEINEETIKEWVAVLRTARVYRRKNSPEGRLISGNSVRRAHTLLHMVLGSAVPKYLKVNPAARPAGAGRHRVGLPKQKPFEGMYLRPWEHERIHAACPPEIADLWFVLIRTGLRLGEILVLRPVDVTVEGNAPEIRVTRALKARGVIGEPKSRTSRRVVTVSSEVAAVLARRCKGLRAQDLIFPSPMGKVWSKHNLRNRFFLPAVAEAMRCADHPPAAPPRGPRGPARRLRINEVSTCDCPGVLRRRPRIHDTRHTHASDCILVGRMLPIEVQHRLGHATVIITLTVYSHLWDGVERERLDEMEQRARAVDLPGPPADPDLAGEALVDPGVDGDGVDDEEDEEDDEGGVIPVRPEPRRPSGPPPAALFMPPTPDGAGGR